MEQILPDCSRAGSDALLNLQPNCSISVAYHPLFGPHDDLILLELDEKLLPDFFEHSISLRGGADDDAVLCTKSKTHAIKFIFTSNSLLLLPPSRSYLHESCDLNSPKPGEAYVLKVASQTLELIEVAPKLDKLKTLLSENPYTSDDSSESKDLKGLYKWEDLTSRVQASDDELVRGLQSLSAVEIDGFWRIVDEAYMDLILTSFLQDMVLNDWRFDDLSERGVVSALEADGFSRELGVHCLNVFGEKMVDGGSSSSSHDVTWRLDERRVCVHFGRRVLRSGRRRDDDLMEELAKRIPEGMKASLEMLEGEVLCESLGGHTWVHAFSLSSLPVNAVDRFDALFRERRKWELRDLEPYIRDLRVPGISPEGLLLKYTRRIQPTPESEPIFCAR